MQRQPSQFGPPTVNRCVLELDNSHLPYVQGGGLGRRDAEDLRERSRLLLDCLQCGGRCCELGWIEGGDIHERIIDVLDGSHLEEKMVVPGGRTRF